MQLIGYILEVPAVLAVKRVPILAGLVAACLVWASVGVAAQDAEEFVAPGSETPLDGYTRSDGTIVLTDESFCRYVLEVAVGSRTLTYVQLLDKTKNQKKARKAAFSATDEAALARCVEVLNASRTEAPEDDPLAAWARSSAIVPQSMAGLLPEDFVAEPLAQPDDIGPAARTSGFGSLVSAPFSITPGPWLAELDAGACGSWSGALHDARDPDTVFPMQGSREYLYDLDGGHYYWDVTASDCDWSVDLVPVVLGPEPTPTPEPRAVVPQLFPSSGWSRQPKAPNPGYLTAAEAREAVLDAGLVTGTCHLESANRRDRVWQQEPIAGTLVDFGTAVDVWIEVDCDIYEGTRVPVE